MDTFARNKLLPQYLLRLGLRLRQYREPGTVLSHPIVRVKTPRGHAIRFADPFKGPMRRVRFYRLTFVEEAWLQTNRASLLLLQARLRQ